MTELKCLVYDEDKFTKELIISFIGKTEGLSLTNAMNAENADVVIVDAALFDGDYMKGLKKDPKIIIISSSKRYIHSFFQNEIADYFMKSELSLHRFEKAIAKIRSVEE